MARLTFIGEKLVFEKSESPLILFYFKRENKIRKKTLKKWLHNFFLKSVFEKPESMYGIQLPIGKVPLKGSTPLSLTTVSID